MKPVPDTGENGFILQCGRVLEVSEITSMNSFREGGGKAKLIRRGAHPPKQYYFLGEGHSMKHGLYIGCQVLQAFARTKIAQPQTLFSRW